MFIAFTCSFKFKVVKKDFKFQEKKRRIKNSEEFLLLNIQLSEEVFALKRICNHRPIIIASAISLERKLNELDNGIFCHSGQGLSIANNNFFFFSPDNSTESANFHSAKCKWCK